MRVILAKDGCESSAQYAGLGPAELGRVGLASRSGERDTPVITF